jgi:hexosaminidase
MCWTGFDACREALQAGHETIMTPVECTYFDFYQSTSLDEPQAIHGLATVKQVFDYDPLPTGGAENLRLRLLGVQANVRWTPPACHVCVHYQRWPGQDHKETGTASAKDYPLC